MHTYFDGLNYSLANEDTWIEYSLLDFQTHRVLSVSGSGARCLPLLAKNPGHIDIVDISEVQLFLAELRIQAARSLTYEEWLFFMGYRGAVPGDPNSIISRPALFEKIKGLQPKTKTFWSNSRLRWEKNGFLFLGKWEQHFQKLGFLFRNILRCDFGPIFKAQTLQDQQKLFKSSWPHRRWKSFLKIVASEVVFDRFLYKGHFSGKADRKTEKMPFSQFVENEFNRLFSTQLARKNYFLQVLFLGEIRYEEGLPLEAQRNIFEQIQSSTTTINYIHCSLLETLTQNSYNCYNFISLSDTISYMPDHFASQILQKIHSNTKMGSLIVIRSFLREPEKLDQKGWQYDPEASLLAQKTDGTGIYRFQIYRKI